MSLQPQRKRINGRSEAKRLAELRAALERRKAKRRGAATADESPRREP